MALLKSCSLNISLTTHFTRSCWISWFWLKFEQNPFSEFDPLDLEDDDSWMIPTQNPLDLLTEQFLSDKQLF
jgi:hypothetical protein